MKSVSLSSERHLAGAAKPRMLDSIARRGLLGRLQGLRNGHLRLMDAGESFEFGEDCSAAQLSARLEVQDPGFFSDVAFGGSIGAAEAYMRGSWQCDDLVSLVRILLRNRPVLESVDGGLGRLTAPLHSLFHRINRNSRAGARRNIAAHYDLGNEFFALWLDESMMYSSAIFEQPEMTLAQAQTYRLDRICKKLNLGAADHVIEIGTGWGGFAVHAARHYGCKVTTTTISNEQYDYSRDLVERSGLSDRIRVVNKDFRDLSGRFDKLVSIEMIEAIDEALYGPYFRKCSELLKPDGLGLIQAITMMDQRYEEYRKSIDFIQRYIFPGSGLPSSAIMTKIIGEQTDMRLLDLEDIGLHYATTLRLWRETFNEQLEAIRALGYSETFIRMWEYYLCYCEAAFLERAISDIHLVFAKPMNRDLVP
jgi:cyclopropane-fatty-acyl-phospholipid synthase